MSDNGTTEQKPETQPGISFNLKFDPPLVRTFIEGANGEWVEVRLANRGQASTVETDRKR